MARPKKQTVDYFPHYCKHKKTMYIIEQRYGNDGYAFWFKLLELLGDTEGHYLDLNDESTWEFLQAKVNLSEDLCIEILSLLAKLGAIDTDLWEERVVWCQNFVDGISDVYKKRRVEIPCKPDFRHLKCKSNVVSGDGNSQSKVKEIKENEIKEKSSKVFADDSEEIILAAKLKELILHNNPKAKVPNDLQKWAQEIDRMIRIDKRTPEEIKAVIEFSQNDSFWSANILSAKALRKQFDRLFMQSNKNRISKINSDDDLPDYWKKDFTGKSSPPDKEGEITQPLIMEAINRALSKRGGG